MEQSCTKPRLSSSAGARRPGTAAQALHLGPGERSRGQAGTPVAIRKLNWTSMIFRLRQHIESRRGVLSAETAQNG
jgi:hypothetical protein